MIVSLIGPPFDGIGGIQQYIRTLERAILDLGHQSFPATKGEWIMLLGTLAMSDRIIITHRNYLPLALFMPWRRITLLLHGIDAEAPLTWLERLALKRVSTIWVISEWTKGLAKKFNKPTEVLYLCAS